MKAAKTLASLCICADLPEPSLLADAMSTEISYTDPYMSHGMKFLILGRAQIHGHLRITQMIMCHLFVLFHLILYVPSSIFQLCREGSSWVEPVIS